jgi:uncharacterized protein YjbJ (UPF0337 family)
MNKDETTGKINDAAGRVERRIGELTGNEETQARGAARQVKGKLQQMKGKIKDATKHKKKEAA